MLLLERHRFFLSLLLALPSNAWTQTSEVANAPVLAQSPKESVAMAESDAAMMQKLSGASGTPPPIAPPAPPSATAPAVTVGNDGTAGEDTFGGAAYGAEYGGQPTSKGEECKVLAGPVGKAMQVLLFLCCCLVLVVKYRRESGDRTWSEFLMDSSKQLIGAGWIHVLNLSFAKGLEEHFKAGDQCTWYWLNIVLDCTLGVAVEYVLLAVLMQLIQRNYPNQAGDFETGDYKNADGNVNPAKYVKQVLMWLTIVTCMKVIMCVIMSLGHSGLTQVAQAVLQPFADNATFKLFVVMIFTPVCFNIFQFWMVDNFIKKKHSADSGMGDVELDGSMRTRIQHGDL